MKKEKNNEIDKKQDVKEVRKQWITPELRVLPVPDRTNAGIFNTRMRLESATYTPS